MSYTVSLSKAALRDLEALQQKDRRRIEREIDQLAADPRPDGCKKLKDMNGLYRVRVGDFRILYLIEDKQLLVLVVRLANRRDAYR
ncbi:MAG: type II toxin-antitoxin system RelE/ParE family toxin [Gemmatimonadales bacterium]